MDRLQQVHAVELQACRDAADVPGIDKALTQHGNTDGLTCPVRHRAYKRGDGGERGGLAFAPACKRARTNPHDKSILASIAGVSHAWHGQIKEVDGLDFHLLCWATPGSTLTASLPKMASSMVFEQPATDPALPGLAIGSNACALRSS